MRNKTFEYADCFKKFKIKLLKQVEYFETNELEDQTLFFDEIQYFMRHEEFDENVEIIKNFDICEKIYFIVSGQVQIEAELHSGEVYPLELLEKGDIIGMYSML